MSDKIHLWDGTTAHWRVPKTKCGRRGEIMNVLYASTAESLKIPPDRMCKTCYRLGPPWLVLVK